jgi:hypothetical protein
MGRLGEMRTLLTAGCLTVVVVAVTLGGGSAAIAGNAPLHQNPCMFMDAHAPTKLVTTDTLFSKVIGVYRKSHPPAVQIAQGPGIGADFQDGNCVVTGGLSYEDAAGSTTCGTGTTVPCDQQYAAIELTTLAKSGLTPLLNEEHFTEKYLPSISHPSGAGPDATIACIKGRGACHGWFTKGARAVLVQTSAIGDTDCGVVFGRACKYSPANIIVEKVMDIAYEHMTPWLTETRSGG